MESPLFSFEEKENEKFENIDFREIESEIVTRDMNHVNLYHVIFNR